MAKTNQCVRRLSPANTHLQGPGRVERLGQKAHALVTVYRDRQVTSHGGCGNAYSHQQGAGVPLSTGRQAGVPCHPPGDRLCEAPAGPPAPHPLPPTHSCAEHRRQLTLLTTDSRPFPRELAFTRDEKEGNGQGLL